MNAKEYLQQIKKIDTLIKNKVIEARQSEENGVDASVIRNGVAQLLKDKENIIENIQLLKEAEYDVLHKVYVQGQTLYEVASDRDISYSMATTIHGRALKNLERIINP